MSCIKQCVSQMAPGFFRCITNSTLAFKSYHKWYLCTQNYLLTFGMHVLQPVVYQISILKQNMKVIPMVPRFCKCITNSTLVFYMYHNWYLCTHNVLSKFGILVLH